MESALRSIFRHNAWANQRLLEHLSTLTEDQLTATTTAVYGNVIATMQHVVGSESFYWSMFSGRFLDWQWHEPARLDELLAWSNEINAAWDELLSTEIDYDAWLVQTRSDGTSRRFRPAILLAQAIHHGNVHREQVSHVLTTLGLTPPDLSLYPFGIETGDYTRGVE
jgi:uncharacterized damage-inducible protein DinB